MIITVPYAESSHLAPFGWLGVLVGHTSNGFIVLLDKDFSQGQTFVAGLDRRFVFVSFMEVYKLKQEPQSSSLNLQAKEFVPRK